MYNYCRSLIGRENAYELLIFLSKAKVRNEEYGNEKKLLLVLNIPGTSKIFKWPLIRGLRICICFFLLNFISYLILHLDPFNVPKFEVINLLDGVTKPPSTYLIW
jgi:hypothetical protein